MGRLHVAQAIAVVGIVSLLAGLYGLIGPNWTLAVGGVLFIVIAAAMVTVK